MFLLWQSVLQVKAGLTTFLDQSKTRRELLQSWQLLTEFLLTQLLLAGK